MIKKRFLSLLCAVGILLTLMPQALAAQTLSADADGVYLIDSAEDLFLFADEVNGGNRTANARLTDDIDLAGEPWTPIGAGYDYKSSGIVPDTAYSGCFDGGGHKISGLFIETKLRKKQGVDYFDTYCQGLFGIIGQNGTVKNLSVDGVINARAKGNEYISAAQYAGGICGINAGLILNCTNNVSVTCHNYAGGICGQLGAQFEGKSGVGGRIINCENNAPVTATSESAAHAGGICGQLAVGEISFAKNHGSVTAPNTGSQKQIVALGGICGGDTAGSGSALIEKSFSYGSVGTGSGVYIGGIIGLCHRAEIRDVYALGEILGGGYTAALAGYMVGGGIENAYARGKAVGSAENSTLENIYDVSADTVTAAQLGDAFIDTDTLPEIDFSKAPTGAEESFSVRDFDLENGKITIRLDRALYQTNLSERDFEISAYVNGEAAELADITTAQSEAAFEIRFAPFNAEAELRVSVDGIEHTITTPASDFWTDYRAAGFSGSGTKSAPYEISTPEELALLAYRVNRGEDMEGAYFALTGSIDLTGKKWLSIGYSDKYEQNFYTSKPFCGSFDGANYEIRGIDAVENGYTAGLFGLCGETARVFDVTLRGSVRNSAESGYAIAGAVCAANYGIIEGCKSYADVTSVGSAGGIAAYNGAVNTRSGGTVNACAVYGSVTAAGECGGIAAFSSGTITACAGLADVRSTDSFAGGICGYNYDDSVLLSGCRSAGEVHAASFAGGICAKAYKSKISNCYSVGKIISDTDMAGGIIGDTVSGYRVKNCYFAAGSAPMPYAENSGTGLEKKTYDELCALTDTLGGDFAATDGLPALSWEISGEYTPASRRPTGGNDPQEPTEPAFEEEPAYSPDGYITASDGFSAGSGTASDPYIIAGASELAYLASAVNGGNSFAGSYIRLACDLDITDKFLTPIGSSPSTPFSASFSGDGHSIAYCSDPDADVSALFGYTDGAKISLLGVRGFSAAKNLAGGICAVAENTRIENCYADIYTKAAMAGGICAEARSGSSISNCYSAGFVNADTAGALFARFPNGVAVENLYYRTIAGLAAVGENYSENTSPAVGKSGEYMQSDAFCYDLWLVRERQKDGGMTEPVDPVFFIGEKYPVLSGAYTDAKVIAVKLSAPGSRLETGAAHKFTAILYAKNADKIKDINWSCDADDAVIKPLGIEISEGTARAFAEITFKSAAENISVACTTLGSSDSVSVSAQGSLWQGSGTAGDPYIIANSDDFSALAASVAAGNSYSGVHFALSSDLDFGGKIAPSVGYFDGFYSTEDGEWFESAKNRAFEGEFDGCGYSVKNALLYAEDSGFGLFSFIGRGGAVKNLVIADSVRVRANNDLRNVSALCGINVGSIESCESYADFAFTAANVNRLAGICGENYASISGCKNYAAMTAAGASKGGICGENYGTITSCENYGELGSAGYAGGICYESHSSEMTALTLVEKFSDMKLAATISECKNLAAITAAYDAGGIVCHSYSASTVNLCENSGEVHGGTAGGIAARVSSSLVSGGIRHSKNSGAIFAASTFAGGICGELINGCVFFCENTGAVAGEKYAGGICGRAYSATNVGSTAVEFSNNYASVSADTYGSIIGFYQDESDSCRVSCCYSGVDGEKIIGETVSRYDTAKLIRENYHLGTADDPYSSEALPDEFDGFEPAQLSVEKDSIVVSDTTSFTSNLEVKSSNEDVLAIEDGKAVGVGVGRAYLYAKASPYSYAAAAVDVSEAPSSAENVSVSFALIGEKAYGAGFVLTKDTPNTYKLWSAKKTYQVRAGSTVGDLLKRVLDESGLKCRGLEQGYVSSISSPDGGWLGEFSNGKYSGWMYTIDGSHPTLGISEQTLSGGEEIIFHYVDDYRYEVADWFADGEYAPLGDGSMHDRWLAAIDSDDDYDDNTDTKPGRNGGSVSGGSKNDTAAVTPAPEKRLLPFSDVAEGSWYYSAVSYAYDNGLFAGVSDTEFAPDAAISRAMLVTVLYRAAGSPQTEPGGFGDVADGTWYAAATGWAAKSGIAAGISQAEFAPDMSITREQLAAMLMRYADSVRADTSARAELAPFADAADCSEYAVPALGWAVAGGIISGKAADTLSPADTATRAEAAAMLMRFFMLLQNK